MKKKNLAFTLAEVFIVIGIIGVVAALTLPNLNHATGDKERVTKVKKIYSALSEAFDRAQAIYGDYDTWFNDFDGYDFIEGNKRFAKRVTEFMKISKDCGEARNSGCFSSESVKTIDNNGSYNLDSSGIAGPAFDYTVITSDNNSLLFNYGCKTVIVDIDGPTKGQNAEGKDIFWFYIKDNIILPRRYDYNGTTLPTTDNNCDNVSKCATAWIIENDNADYLKADSTGKCNDSNIVLDWTTNTSCH